MMPTRRWLAGSALLALLAGVLLALHLVLREGPAEETYATHHRPDGRYSVVVVRKPSRWASMPGQGSDSPGEVRLLDRDQRVLHRAEVAMVQQVERVEWQDRRVTIKLVADWPLPD